MKVQRVLCVAMLAVMLACAAVSQAAEVKIRVAGFGGTDTAIVEELIARFVQPNLTGIQVAYEPIPDAYDKWEPLAEKLVDENQDVDSID